MLGLLNKNRAGMVTFCVNRVHFQIKTSIFEHLMLVNSEK